MKNRFLRRAAAALATVGLIGWTPVSRGEESAIAFQYELSLGGGRVATSTFYLCFQSEQAGTGASFNTDSSSTAARLPVYSTDPGVLTAFSELSGAMHAAQNGRMTAGEVGGFVLGAVIYFAIPIYRVAKEWKDWDEAWDLPGLEFPETPAPAPEKPGAGAPAPARPGAPQ